jgi:hypothetical protein
MERPAHRLKTMIAEDFQRMQENQKARTGIVGLNEINGGG